MSIEEILQAVKSRKLAPAEAARLMDLSRTQPNADNDPGREARGSISLDSIREMLISSFAKALYMECSEVKCDQSFVDMGLDSIIGVEWIKEINRRLQLELPATTIYDYSTIDMFADYLVSSQVGSHPVEKQNPAAQRALVHETHRARADGDLALVVSRVHTLDEIALSPWQIEQPGATEITVQVKASGINFPDAMCVNGLYPTMPKYPFVPGFEVAGVVVNKGEGVTEFDVGDEIIGLTGARLGGHAHFVNLPQDNAVRKPKNISFAEACSLPVVFGIVHYAFELADLRAGEQVLIHTATGGCGLLALQLARLKGATCIGTSSRDHKLEILQKLNVEHAINYKTPFDKTIKELTQGRGVDVVLNMLSGEAIQRGLNCLAPSGRYLEIAVHALKTSPKLSLSHLLQNQSFHSIDLRTLSLTTGRGAKESLAIMVHLLEQERIVPVVSKIYPFSKIAEALEFVGQGEHIGKVVVDHECDQVMDLTDACMRGILKQEQRALKARANQQVISVSAAKSLLARSAQSELQSNDAESSNVVHSGPVAVIGLSGQFPKSPSPAQFWRNIAEGENCVTEVSSNRWSVDKFYSTDSQAIGKTNCKWLGELTDADKFDPQFFNISPTEALVMDPQQRLILQGSWSCIEDAGIDPSKLSSMPCGVFVGVAPGDYGHISNESGLSSHALLGNSLSILAARISFFLNLRGPCITLDTACSSALVAITEACNHLQLGTCKMALAGGVNVMAGPGLHIMTSKAEMLSSDGRCYTFDQRANGFVPSEGVGVVLLKRLVDAQRDGDSIQAVIRGWGVNQDGRTNGITAPSASSQTQLQSDVYRKFDIDPSSITLMEAHGTGTKLGDPIEVRAVTDAFRKFTSKQGYCALGSVKSNMGHAMAAAGIAGFIKVVMALKHKQLPPTINFDRLNEHVQIAGTPFYINTSLKPWSTEEGVPRRGAVSSFGFSGTNAHIVLEEGPEYQHEESRRKKAALPCHLIALSARNSEQLKVQAAQLLEYLTGHTAGDLGNVSYTLLNGRKHFKCRLAVVVENADQLKTKLQQWLATGHAEGVLVSALNENERTERSENKALQKFTQQCLTDCAIFAAAYRTTVVGNEAVADYREKLAALAAAYTEGDVLEFDRLFDRKHHRPVSLPTYPFAKRRFWIAESEVAQAPRSDESKTTAVAASNKEEKRQDVQPAKPPAGKLSLGAFQAVSLDAAPVSKSAVKQQKISLSLGGFSEQKTSEPIEKELVSVVDHGRGVFVIELNDTASKNEVSSRLLQQLKSCQQKIAQDESAKVILLKGGAEYFARGSVEALSKELFTDLLRLSVECALPIIAVCKGDCPGLGWLLASQCDLLLCAEEATLGYVTTPSARAPFAWESVYLNRRFGKGLADSLLDSTMLLTGHFIKSGKFGIATAPRSQIDAIALDMAYSLASMPRLSLVELKRHYAKTSLAFIQAIQQGADPATLDRVAAVHAKRRSGQDSWMELSSDDEPIERVNTEQFTHPRQIALSSNLVRMVEFANGVVEIQLCDEAQKNMLSAQLATGIAEAFSVVAQRAEYSVVILTGYDQYFSLGGNKESLEAIQQGALKFSDTHIYSVALDCEIPVIAAMQGHGIGAGWALGMYADYVILSSESIYISPYMGFGFTPGAGATLIFPYQFGSDLGKEILFTAREYQGRELAQRCGDLPVLPRNDVVARARQLAARLAKVPREKLVLTKNRLCAALRENIAATYEQELAMHELTFVGNSAVWQTIQRRFADDSAGPQVAVSENDVIEPAQASARENADLLQDTLQVLRSTLADQLGLGEEEIPNDVQFMELGLDSVVGVTWIRKVNQVYDLAIAVTKVYQYPTLKDFAHFVFQERAKRGEAVKKPPVEVREMGEPQTQDEKKTVVAPEQVAQAAPSSDAAKIIAQQSSAQTTSAAKEKATPEASTHEIAIVGMAGRFPLSNSVEEFWKNIAGKVNCIREVTRWSIADYFDTDRNKQGKSYSKWMGAMEGVDEFDPLFFNISPQEALAMDPQQRLLLMAAWECIEDAGYDPTTMSASRCGVFVGCGPSDYGFSQDKALNAEGLTGSSSSILAGRVSYFLNLRGPCIAIDTACSSSLVAIAQACDSLLLNNCDLALAGGVCVMAGPTIHIMTSNAGMLSPDGRCHAFDQKANGFVPGEGVGVVLLKRLQDAIAAGDHIDGVLGAWGINQDGKTNGITAPNPESQASLERETYKKFNVDPARIQLVETHGTGTRLGDPIEIEALVESFGSRTDKRNYCALGSVKSNVGHLQAAAGVASLIKVVMALKNRQLPPTINFNALNEFIDLGQSPFYINTELRPWNVESGARRQAAISSFGFSGTNAHVVVAEHEGSDVDNLPALGRVLVVLSAQTMAQLDAQGRKLLARIKTMQAQLPPDTNSSSLLTSIAYTLQVGRHGMEERLAFVVASIDELVHELAAYLDGKPDAQRCFRGTSKRQETSSTAVDSVDLENWAQTLQLESIASVWVKGVTVDWTMMSKAVFGERLPQRISLPTYAFAKESYWLGDIDSSKSNKPGSKQASAPRHFSLPKNLLMAREYWQESSQLLDEGTLRDRAASKGAQRILILYRRVADFEGLQKALLYFWSGFTSKLLIESLRIEDVDTSTDSLDRYLSTHAAPNVLFYVPADSSTGGENELRQLLQTAQILIKRAGAKPVELYHCYVRSQDATDLYREGLAGLFRAIAMEHPAHCHRNIACDRLADVSDYRSIVAEWLMASSASQVPVQIPELRYQQGKRYVTRFSEWQPETTELAGSSIFRSGATYLMVGALGEAGLQMCLALAREFQPRLVILSRRAGDRTKDEYLDDSLSQIERAGAQVSYHSVDISDAEKLGEVLRRVRMDVGPIQGVFHFARAVADGPLQEKTFASFRNAIAAKVTGTVKIDTLTANDPLEFFIVFSSMAAFGIAGSADYGYAAAFQNAFVRDRNRKCLKKQRQGVSIAFCWGQWVVDAYSDKARDAALAKMGFDFIDAPFALHTMGIALHELQTNLERTGMDGNLAVDVLGAMAVSNRQQVRQLYGLADPVPVDSKPKAAYQVQYPVADSADDLSIDDLLALDQELNGDDAAMHAALLDRSYDQLDKLYRSLANH